jgi:hypothetical protein
MRKRQKKKNRRKKLQLYRAFDTSVKEHYESFQKCPVFEDIFGPAITDMVGIGTGAILVNENGVQHVPIPELI